MERLYKEFMWKDRYRTLFAGLIIFIFTAAVTGQPPDTCFEVSSDVNAVNTAHSVTAGDFNEDGFLDIAVVAHRPKVPKEGLVVMLGDGKGAFTQVDALSVGDHNHGIITADFNNDGHLD